MSDKSNIEWTEATWNPVRGCTKVSPGCAHCYAETFAERFRGVKGHSYEQGFDLRLVPEKLAEPLHWKKPRRIFINSMSDLFQDGVPFSFIAAVFAVMSYCDRHTFQVLTKRADRMLEFMEWVNAPAQASRHGLRMCAVESGFADQIYRQSNDGLDLDACLYNHGTWPLPNVWLGVSVENQHFADERIPLLLKTPAAVRFISYEPALGPVDLTRVQYRDEDCDCEWNALTGDHQITNSTSVDSFTTAADGNTKLDWVICGGESGLGARPFDLAWARSVVAQCKAVGVACFVKQLGSRPVSEPYDTSMWVVQRPGVLPFPLADRKGGEMSEWPEDLRVREFPQGAR